MAIPTLRWNNRLSEGALSPSQAHHLFQDIRVIIWSYDDDVTYYLAKDAAAVQEAYVNIILEWEALGLIGMFEPTLTLEEEHLLRENGDDELEEWSAYTHQEDEATQEEEIRLVQRIIDDPTGAQTTYMDDDPTVTLSEYLVNKYSGTSIYFGVTNMSATEFLNNILSNGIRARSVSQ